MANKVQTVSGASTTQLARQYIYGPLQAMTISANTAWTLYARGMETLLANHFPASGVWIATSTGSLRGTIRVGGSSGGGSEWGTSLSSRQFHPISISYSSISVQNGDYLVIEVGTVSNAFGGSGSVTLNFGDDSASNITANNITTADNPIFFLNADLAIYNPDISATVSQGTMTMTGQAMTGASAQVTPSVSQGALTLTGQAMTAVRHAQTATAAQGTLTLTGKDLTGASADGVANIFTQAVLTFEGQDFNASWEAPDTALMTRGVLTFTGKAMTKVTTEVLAVVDGGTLTLLGQDAVGRANVLATVSQGTLTLNGQSFAAAAILAAIVSHGTLTLTGKDFAASAAVSTGTLTRGTLTFTGTIVAVRQGFSFYQVHII